MSTADTLVMQPRGEILGTPRMMESVTVQPESQTVTDSATGILLDSHRHSESYNDNGTNGLHNNGATENHDIMEHSTPSSRRKRDQKQIVEVLLQDAKSKGSVALDLSRKALRKIPDELLTLTHLEYLYLEGNELACLPEHFFDCLPNLQWLDLRNNALQSLPTAYIGRHETLSNLLLQGNELRTLPLELGLVTTLSGLSICDNPLEFPPHEVIERGTQTVLTFLREVLRAKSLGKFPADTEMSRLSDFQFVLKDDLTLPKLEDLKLDSEDNSSEDEWGLSRGSRKLYGSQSQRSGKLSKNSSAASGQFTRSNSDQSDLVGPVMHSASLQRRTSYNEKKQQQLEKLKKAGALGLLEREISAKSMGKKKLAKLSQYPEPPPVNRVEKAYLEERRLSRLKDLKEKQEMVLQRRRDQDVLKEWRHEGKQKQVIKQREKMIKGKIEFDEPAKLAPFGVDQGHMKMETNEERIARDIREKHEKLRRPVSPETQQKMEENRATRDRELQKKLEKHTHQMQERRRKPKGTPQEEMEAAKKELQIAEQLQQEIEQRRKALEYRFTAFTGDV